MEYTKNYPGGTIMKMKTFLKKLVLNKKTIANLGNGDMSDVKGGGSKDLCTQGAVCTRDCESFPVIECPTINNCPTDVC
jgi:hypothetical protein